MTSSEGGYFPPPSGMKPRGLAPLAAPSFHDSNQNSQSRFKKSGNGRPPLSTRNAVTGGRGHKSAGGTGFGSLDTAGIPSVLPTLGLTKYK